MKIRTWLFAAAASAALGMTSFSFAADLSGTVKLDGTAPERKPIDMSAVADCQNLHADPVMDEHVVANEQGMLANVVVSVKKEDSPDLTGDVPTEPALLDQEGCVYKPHVLAMMVGQDLVVKNSDNFLHNVHTLSEVNPSFNKAQPSKNDGEKVEAPKAPEVFPVKCDVHPWMSSYIAVFDHPFFSVTDQDGKFTIKNLPDGEYTLVAWHEKFGTQEKKVKFEGGKAAEEVVFSFKPEVAEADAVSNVILASDSGEKKGPCGGDCCGGKGKSKAAEAK